MTGVLIAESRDELTDRVRTQLELTGGSAAEAEAWLGQRQERWVMGTLDEAGERLRAFEAAGVQRVMLQDFIPRDLDMIRLMGRLGS
jgi:alkanesulfonate monooxygenase SsuD/methylene tetrahydromethanopterin reductase-like flavin-dependent oxidoreductase (luciferase family)